jgi:hypothetical protein
MNAFKNGLHTAEAREAKHQFAEYRRELRELFNLHSLKK